MLSAASTQKTDAEVLAGVQKALDPYCLLQVHINPESRVKVGRGAAKPELQESGWRVFLVKVVNEAGVTAGLKANSPNAMSVFESGYQTESDRELRGRMIINGNNRHNKPAPPARDRWMDMQMYDGQPLLRTLSGLGLEYRILQIYSRDVGQREGKISFHVGQGTQDIGFRGETDILFTAKPASTLTLRVRDEKGSPTTAMFIIRDRQGRVYPSQAKRLAPDFAFHPQIYRKDGEKVRLPAGSYMIEYTRGPEYLWGRRATVMNGRPQTISVQLQRWIDPSIGGWWSGDHHIHAAGCAHYDNPSEGVHAPDMARHCQGEDLKIGANLTWGPCFDYQKQFFTGKDDKVSTYPYLLRYDIEVSGFGSHQSGHLCLLRLKEGMYPGGDSWKHWPTLGLNTLKWAKRQGAVTGPAHSGNGLALTSRELPTYEVPPFNGIGAQEFIVDITHMVPGPTGALVPAIDFMSTVDTPYQHELNLWYHVLNAGYRPRISGETDFPCISGERVGMGRSYVKLDGKLNYDDWCEGIRLGRCYVSDGNSHLMDFKVGTVPVGEQNSELKLPAPGSVAVTVRAAALIPTRSTAMPPKQGGYWDIERARIDGSRKVPVELIVNGYPVAKTIIEADGTEQQLSFDVRIERSSWVAVRIPQSSHTNPVFVIVGDRPVRASRRSVQWCIESVEQCWRNKERTYAPAEMQDAIEAYNHARREYRRILAETEVD
jgi:hypothetical protein